MMKNLKYFCIVCLIIISCQTNDDYISEEDFEQSEINREVNLKDAKAWFLEEKANIPIQSFENNSDSPVPKITALSVEPIWNLSRNWTYMEEHPMIIVPFNENAFIPNTPTSGAKLFIYKNDLGNYTASIVGYLAEESSSISSGSLSMSNFNGINYQIDTYGRIGNIRKLEDGNFVAYAELNDDVLIDGINDMVTYRDPECPSWGNSGGF